MLSITLYISVNEGKNLVTVYSDDLTPEEHAKARDEFVDMAEDEQIAEGDITVSDTVDGKNPLPDLDDSELRDEILGEDNLLIADEDDAGLTFDEEDDYIDDSTSSTEIKDYVLTSAGYKALQQRLEAYKQDLTEQREEMENIQFNGDEHFPEEAAEYDVRIRQELLEERVRHLELVLSSAQIITEDPDIHTVDVGDRVTVWNESEEKMYEYDILGTTEVQYGREGITIDSPVGHALHKGRIGDVVTVDIPDGQVTYIIRDIQPTPEE